MNPRWVTGLTHCSRFPETLNYRSTLYPKCAFVIIR